MATPAAVLAVLVKADGVAQTSSAIRGLNTDLTKATGIAGRTGTALEDTGRRGSRAGSAIKTGFAALGGIAVFDVLRRGVGSMIDEFEESRRVAADTAQSIRKTGGAANVTAEDVSNLAASIARKTGIDDEAIQSGQNLLLSFKSIQNQAGEGNAIFDRATQTMTDLSVKMGGDTKQAALQLGKALEDPTTGITALKKAGVSFTIAEKEKIATLVESGKTMEAQKIILDSINKQGIGGQAEAQATAMGKLKVVLGDLAEVGGSILVPILDRLANGLIAFIEQAQAGTGLGGTLADVFRTLGDVIGTLLAPFISFADALIRGDSGARALAAGIGVVVIAIGAMKVAGIVTGLVYGLAVAMGVAGGATGLLSAALAVLFSPVTLIVAAIAAVVAALVLLYNENETVRAVIDDVWNFILTNVQTVVGWLVENVPKAWALIMENARTSWAFIEEYIVGPIGDAVEFAIGVTRDVVEFMKDRFLANVEIVRGAWELVRQFIVDPLKAAFDWIGTALAAVGQFISDRWNEIKSGAKTAWDAIGGFISGAIETAINTVETVVKDVITFFNDKWSSIKSTAEKVWNAVGGFISGAVQDAIAAVKRAIGAVITFFTEKWASIKSDAQTVWKDVGGFISGGVEDAVAIVERVIKAVKGFLSEKWKQISTRVSSFATNIKDTLVKAFEGAANLVIKFINMIIGAINTLLKAVGVQEIGVVAEIGGGDRGRDRGRSQGFAKGGIVRAPTYVMGEEAPLHPEIVIPTNPAYRNRAHALLGTAAKMIGYAKGGIVSGRVSVFGPPVEAAGTTASGVSSSLPGIAIYNQATLGKIFDVSIGSKSARLKQTDIGPAPWTGRVIDVTGAGSRAMGINPFSFPTDSQGRAVPVGGGEVTAGGSVDADTITKLPGVGMLPTWLQGMGRFVLEAASKFIADTTAHFADVFGGGGGMGGGIGGGGGGDLGGGGGGFAAVEELARSLGLSMTSGTRGPRFPGDTSLHIVGRARDYSNSSGPTPQMMEFAQTLISRMGSRLTELFYTPLGYSIKNGARADFTVPGHLNHVHVAFRKGGILSALGAMGGEVMGGLPFVGSYARGGRVPSDGLAYVHEGEDIIPRGAANGNGPMVNIEYAEFNEKADLDLFGRQLAFRLATG